MLAAIGFRVEPADAARQCAAWELAMRCDAVGNLTQTRTKVPQSFLIRSRAIPPAEAEITVKPRPCWERTNWNSPGLWAAPWGLVAPRVVIAMRLASAACRSV